MVLRYFLLIFLFSPFFIYPSEQRLFDAQEVVYLQSVLGILDARDKVKIQRKKPKARVIRHTHVSSDHDLNKPVKKQRIFAKEKQKAYRNRLKEAAMFFKELDDKKSECFFSMLCKDIRCDHEGQEYVRCVWRYYKSDIENSGKTESELSNLQKDLSSYFKNKISAKNRFRRK